MNNTSAIGELPAALATEGVRKGRAREVKSTKRAGTKPKTNALERYFLANDSPGETVAMGRELGSEQEALVAAFQEKATFFVVTEYRVETQFKGANALLVKEGVSRADR